MYSAESRRQDFILPLVCLLWQCNLQKKSHWTHNSQSTAFKTECKICCRKHCVNAVILDTEKTLTNTGNYVQMQKCPLCQIYETYKCTILISALTFLKSCHDCNGFICMQMKKTPSSIWQHMHSILKKKTTLQSDKRQPNTESAASSDNTAKQQNANTKVQPNIGCLKVV